MRTIFETIVASTTAARDIWGGRRLISQLQVKDRLARDKAWTRVVKFVDDIDETLDVAHDFDV